LKIKILDTNGEKTVDAGSITVNGVTLEAFINRLVKLETEVKKKFDALEKREQTLKEAIKKL
jgi:hypothetical protein